MFGKPLDGSVNVFCDSEVVYPNATFIKSKLKQKYNSIYFHLVREAVAAGKMVVFKVDVRENLADLLTKLVPRHRRKYLWSKIMFTEEKEGKVTYCCYDQLQRIYVIEDFFVE